MSTKLTSFLNGELLAAVYIQWLVISIYIEFVFSCEYMKVLIEETTLFFEFITVSDEFATVGVL